MLKSAVNQAVGTIRKALGTFNTETTGNVSQQRTRMNRAEQLEVFSRMSDSDFEKIKEMHGESGLRAYVDAMRSLARNN